MRKAGASVIVAIASPFIVLGWTNNYIARSLMALAEKIRAGGR